MTADGITVKILICCQLRLRQIIQSAQLYSYFCFCSGQWWSRGPPGNKWRRNGNWANCALMGAWLMNKWFVFYSWKHLYQTSNMESIVWLFVFTYFVLLQLYFSILQLSHSFIHTFSIHRSKSSTKCNKDVIFKWLTRGLFSFCPAYIPTTTGLQAKSSVSPVHRSNCALILPLPVTLSPFAFS